MRVVLIIVLLLLGFAGYLWYLGGESAGPGAGAEPDDATRQASSPALIHEDGSAQEAGVYYLTAPVRASTSAGMKDFSAGSKWELVGESGTAFLLTNGENTITVERSKTTQDPAQAKVASRQVASTATDQAGQEAEMRIASYQQQRHSLEEKIGTHQDRIANEQTKIRATKGEGGGTLRPDVKNLSHGAKHTIQVAEERITGFRSEIAEIKKEISRLGPPPTMPSGEVVAASSPVPEVIVEVEDAPPGLMSRIELGFQRLSGKN